jgi:hypothetical protein
VGLPADLLSRRPDIAAAQASLFAADERLRVLERFSAWPFVIYRFVLGIFLLSPKLKTMLMQVTAFTQAARGRTTRVTAANILPLEGGAQGEELPRFKRKAGAQGLRDVKRQGHSTCGFGVHARHLKVMKLRGSRHGGPIPRVSRV